MQAYQTWLIFRLGILSGMFFVLFTVLVIAGMKTVANSCNYVSKKSFVHAESFQDIMIVKLGAEFQVTVIGCSYAIMAVLWIFSSNVWV